jgi:hypothetical protein
MKPKQEKPNYSFRAVYTRRTYAMEQLVMTLYHAVLLRQYIVETIMNDETLNVAWKFGHNASVNPDRAVHSWRCCYRLCNFSHPLGGLR